MSERRACAVHQLLAEVLGRGVRVLRPDGVGLVDRDVVGQEAALGEEEAGHGLARDVDDAPRPEPDRGLQHVERRHQVVAEHRVGRVLRRLGDGGGVHHGVMAAHDRVRVAGIGQVGLRVGDALAARRLEQRAREVRRRDLVAGGVEGGDGGGPDLAAGAGHEDAHGANRYPIAAASRAAALVAIGVVRLDSHRPASEEYCPN